MNLEEKSRPYLFSTRSKASGYSEGRWQFSKFGYTHGQRSSGTNGTDKGTGSDSRA